MPPKTGWLSDNVPDPPRLVIILQKSMWHFNLHLPFHLIWLNLPILALFTLASSHPLFAVLSSRSPEQDRPTVSPQPVGPSSCKRRTRYGLWTSHRSFRIATSQVPGTYSKYSHSLPFLFFSQKAPPRTLIG